ncbi:MAG: hypothetical protein GQ565_08810 [Candidatus Aegiribacteria sp.]|nr:hypothetical protein [Candidatus Aegiribacteria sp.]
MNITTFSPESNTFPTLFPVEVDTNFSDILREGFALLNKDPDILKRIEHDLDCYAMQKKARRLADKDWRDRQTLPLGLELQEFADSLEDSEEEIKISLGTGRPRMRPEIVFLFILFRGYFESVTDIQATDRIIDSITIRSFFQIHGWGNLPKRSTIHENIQAVSYETRNYVYLCQLADVKDQGIDDYKRLTLDSTAVMANSSWPVDSGVIYRLLDRAFRNSQNLSKYGVPNFMPWHSELWLSKISSLNFRINVVSGKGAKVARRGFYRTLYTEAGKIIAHMLKEMNKHMASMEMADLPPTLAKRLTQLRTFIENDIEDAESVIGYSRRRVLNGETIPNSEKILRNRK